MCSDDEIQRPADLQAAIILARVFECRTSLAAVTPSSSGPHSQYCSWSTLSGTTVTLLEKLFIVTPGIHYWCRLVTVADTNNGGLTTRYQ
jgi:hypothetical protein